MVPASSPAGVAQKATGACTFFTSQAPGCGVSSGVTMPFNTCVACSPAA